MITQVVSEHYSGDGHEPGKGLRVHGFGSDDAKDYIRESK